MKSSSKDHFSHFYKMWMSATDQTVAVRAMTV